jgi:hypothetical protein
MPLLSAKPTRTITATITLDSEAVTIGEHYVAYCNEPGSVFDKLVESLLRELPRLDKEFQKHLEHTAGTPPPSTLRVKKGSAAEPDEALPAITRRTKRGAEVAAD